RQDAPMAGLVRLLERGLADPRRLRALLRFQAAFLAHEVLTGDSGLFAFEPRAVLTPMFQAFPLQSSLAALAVEGARHRERLVDNPAPWSGLVFARQAVRGGNPDRSGLSPQALR